MKLTMYRARDGVRFEFADDEMSSSVTLSSEDDGASIIRKLKRIVSLAEGGPAPGTDAAARVAAESMGIEVPRSVAPPVLTDDQRTNGWDYLIPSTDTEGE